MVAEGAGNEVAGGNSNEVAGEEKKELSPQEKLNQLAFAAVSMGNLEQLKYLIEKGADPEYVEGAHSMMRLAVLRCMFHIVRYLHEECGVSIKDDKRLLHMAALGKVKHPEMLIYLKEKENAGQDINHDDEKLGTPLMLCLYKDDKDEQFARWLLKEGADPSIQQAHGERSSALHKACRVCSQELVKLILDKGATTLIPVFDGMGMTPLMHAASDGRHEIVDMLVNDYGADPNQESEYTAIFLACQNAHHQCAKILCEAGADVNFKDTGETGCAPLHLAASNSHLAIMKLLVQCGANVNVTDKRGYTPLMMAGSEGYMEAVEYLLSVGGNPNQQAGKDGFTTLHHAVIAQRPYMIALLLKNGADPNIKDINGFTAMQVAREAALPHMVNALENFENLDDPTKTCPVCFKFLEHPKRCSACRSVYYCSAECQKTGWKVHKKECKKVQKK